MTKIKKYDIKTINFGEAGHPARTLVEKYVKRNGNKALSQLIRKLIVIYLSNDPSFKEFKNQILIHERVELGKELAQKMARKVQIDEELTKAGVDVESVLYERS